MPPTVTCWCDTPARLFKVTSSSPVTGVLCSWYEGRCTANHKVTRTRRQIESNIPA